MARDLTRSLHALFGPLSEALKQMSWQPAVDIYRTRRGWLIKFDLAGVRPEDVSVTVADCRLTVRGRRRDWVIEESRDYRSYSMEIAYSEFERTLEIPCDLPSAQVTTRFREGMLLVELETGESES